MRAKRVKVLPGAHVERLLVFSSIYQKDKGKIESFLFRIGNRSYTKGDWAEEKLKSASIEYR